MRLLALLALALCDYVVNDIRHAPAGWKLALESAVASGYPGDFKDLDLWVRYYSRDVMNLHIAPPAARFEVPDAVLKDLLDAEPAAPSLTFDVVATAPLEFQVRSQTSRPVFHMGPAVGDTGSQLFFADQFLQFSTRVPARTVVNGFGIRMAPFALEAKRYALWTMEPNGVKEDENIYSAHPFLLLNLPPTAEHGAECVGLLLKNASGVEVEVPEDGGNLVIRAIGGVMDVSLIHGPTADDVVRRYHDLVGRPYFHPRWALGVSQCSFEYFNVGDFRNMVARYEESGIPLDIVFSDINVMDKRQDFTLEQTQFNGESMSQFVDELHAKYMRYVPILDPGQLSSEENRWYQEMVAYPPEEWAYVKCPAEDAPLITSCWPGLVAMPDFTSPRAREMWGRWVHDFNYDETAAPFDGLWIDMNDPSTFCSGYCPNKCGGTKTAAMEALNAPPYVVGHSDKMYHETIDLSARHYLGYHYDVHNMYAFYETAATRDALDEVYREEYGVPVRSLLLSRGSYLGSGRYGGSWLGDNRSNYAHLLSSVSMIQQANLHGISLAGPDLGGFMGNADEELVVRWYGLAVFYPFLRNHYSLGTARQEPYLYSETAQVAIKAFIQLRYTFTPYLYTELYRVHRYGGMIWRPVYYEFPETLAAHADFADSSMIGRHILLTAVPQIDAEETLVHVPAGSCWRDLAGRLHTADDVVSTTRDSPAPVYLRCGSAIVRHFPGRNLIATTFGAAFISLVLPDSDAGPFVESLFYADDGLSVPRFEDPARYAGGYVESAIRVAQTGSTFRLTNTCTERAAGQSGVVISCIELVGARPGDRYRLDGQERVLEARDDVPFSASGFVCGVELDMSDNWVLSFELVKS